MDESRCFHPDVVYYNCSVVTMDEANPGAEAVATMGEKIVAVGPASKVKQLAGPNTRMVDLGGKTMLPGLIEPHSHPHHYQYRVLVANLRCPPAGPITSLDQLLGTLSDWAKRTPKDQWIIGFGYDEFQMEERRHPTRYDLDRVCADRPIFITQFSCHICVANSKVLEIAGVTRDTPNPTGGVIRRDAATGEPDGVVEEAAWKYVYSFAPRSTPEHRLEALAAAASDHLRTGVTSLCVPASFVYSEDMPLYQRAIARGLWPLRTTVGYPPEILLGERTGAIPFITGFGNNRLKLGPVKQFVDGSVVGCTAWLSEPYHTPHGGDSSYRGYAVNTPERVKQVVRDAHREGFQVSIHAAGDAAVDLALEAIRLAQEEHPRPDARHRIEHAHVVREDQLDAMAELGATPSFNPGYVYYWGERNKSMVLGPERAARLHPLRLAVDRGIRFSLHSDSPMTWVSPLFCVWAAVNRLAFGGEVLGPEFRITPYQALKAVTVDAAWQNFEEGIKGSIEVGKLADFTVLAENPLAVSPERIRDIGVQEVIVGGESVYRAG